jgi:RNA polymerase sigma factor (sigma-70 family)
VRERTNEQWLAELRGPNPGKALADLYDLLVRGLKAALGGYGGSVEANVGDFAQEALIKITGNLDSFRGESRFTTWAQKIAMNVALTELKRRRWRDVSLQDLFAQREVASGKGVYMRKKSTEYCYPEKFEAKAVQLSDPAQYLWDKL